MTTLAEALDQSYRGILNGADLATAHLGDQEKQWAEPVEVRRNLVTNPRAASLSGWDMAWSASSWTRTLMVEGGVPFVRFENTAPSTFLMQLGQTPPIIGEVYSCGVDIRTSAPVSNFRIQVGGSAGPFQSLINGAWVEVKREAVVAVSTALTRLNIEQTLATGTIVDVRLPIVEKSPTISPYFDGNGPSPDPDTLAEWAGTPNASESILWGWPE